MFLPNRASLLFLNTASPGSDNSKQFLIDLDYEMLQTKRLVQMRVAKKLPSPFQTVWGKLEQELAAVGDKTPPASAEALRMLAEPLTNAFVSVEDL